MGCGTSRGVPVLEEDGPEAHKDALSSQPEGDDVDLSSVRSPTPDQNSKLVDPQSPAPVPAPAPAPSPPAPLPNGTSAASSLSNGLSDTPDHSAPTSAGTRGVAFEVTNDGENGESLIKRHPPKKFQKLEDLQQGPALTQEKLEEKQAIAERRRQEILTQRVQSAKQRSARSAGRMRARNTDADEVETLDDGIIESAANVSTENEL
ncbi:ensconsin-like [Penaeus indicus]|uniref:ensconsin-like n=1 Tax=Penaeus indicus TaxID=29960 RepID=UPI00300C67FA